jgi:GNAT superfamily N-acetyltransferase
MSCAPGSVHIRAPRVDELERLQEIETAAFEVFRDIGMPAIADVPVCSTEELEGYRAAGRAWVGVVAEGDDTDLAVACVLVDVLDGAAHVELLNVHPSHARKGIGRQLLDHVVAWAAKRELTPVTLTTYRDVAWNAPYYERCGFRPLPPDERGPELVTRMVKEAAEGLDPSLRVAMWRSE